MVPKTRSHGGAAVPANQNDTVVFGPDLIKAGQLVFVPEGGVIYKLGVKIQQKAHQLRAGVGLEEFAGYSFDAFCHC